MTSDTSECIRFAAHRTLAKEFFGGEYKVLFANQFEEVAWRHVYDTLMHEVPKLFALWACKQVMRVAATNAFMHNIDKRSKKCPSCTTCDETTAHILQCEESGRVKAFKRAVKNLEIWMEDMDTDPGLIDSITAFAMGRGGVSMESAVSQLSGRYQRFGISQDKIGWLRFMEGMVSKEVLSIQAEYTAVSGSRLSVKRWMSGLITRLLEITHGQWIYRNFVVHDHISGTIANKKKEEIQAEIETQQDLGGDGLLEEDMFLAEVNLEDLESSSGERQAYWLLAIQAARQARIIHDRQTANATQENTT